MKIIHYEELDKKTVLITIELGDGTQYNGNLEKEEFDNPEIAYLERAEKRLENLTKVKKKEA